MKNFCFQRITEFDFSKQQIFVNKTIFFSDMASIFLANKANKNSNLFFGKRLGVPLIKQQ